MPPYDPMFPKGSAVRVKSTAELEQFKQQWTWHHPLTTEQIGFAGTTHHIASVSFYHGGDCLYELESVPCLWHEECLDRTKVKT